MKCLIVEDDFASKELLRAYMKDCADCHTVSDGRQAVEAFLDGLEENEPYDLILLDIMMPEVNGREALQEIRWIEAEHGIEGLDAVKVIMTTALDDSKNILGSFREGCEAYVVKPVEKDKLFAEIEKLGLLSFSR